MLAKSRILPGCLFSVMINEVAEKKVSLFKFILKISKLFRNFYILLIA